ncbi:MAG: DNA mismatch repair endonuclease MutH [Aeromonas sp.]
MRPSIDKPTSAAELLVRAEALAGLTFGQLAALAGRACPADLKRDKGWVGQLIEWHLGASAGSKPEQDFPELGIELKTIPIDRYGKPLETTFVCVAPLLGLTGLTWAQSNVRNKLSCVLWVPIEGERQIPLAQRRVGTAFLWQPSPAQEAVLAQDWEELMELITLGQVEQITARHGQALQLRPKAANNRALTAAVGAEGQPIMTLPRGFYLKIGFTHQLLQAQFGS